MTNIQNPEQIIAQVVAYARQAVGQLSFDERADMVARVVDGVREALKTETTSGGAPEGREWELKQLAKVRNAAQRYADEASQLALSKPSQ